MNGWFPNQRTHASHSKWRVLLLCKALSVLFVGWPAAAQDLEIINVRPTPQVDDNPDLDLEDPLANVDTDGVQVSDALRELVQQLNDDSYDVRESTTNQIAAGSFDLAQLYVILKQDELSLEQRHRLLVAARKLLRETPRGALGIRMRPIRRIDDPQLVELEVDELLPDLPARRVLQLGDRITAIEGVALRGNNDLIRYAQIRTPGTPIQLTIRRIERDDKGQTILNEDGTLRYVQLDVTVELGSAELLRTQDGQVQQGSPVQLSRDRQAMWMEQRFGTKPDHLEIDRTASQLHNARLAVAVRAGDDLVEKHYYIKELRRDLRLLDNGADRNRITAVWDRRMLDLQNMINDPRTSAEDRDFLRQVLRKYLEIISEAR